MVSPIVTEDLEREGTDTLAIALRVMLSEAVILPTYVPDRVAWMLNTPVMVGFAVPSSLWFTLCVVVPRVMVEPPPVLIAAEVKLFAELPTVQLFVLEPMYRSYEVAQTSL